MISAQFTRFAQILLLAAASAALAAPALAAAGSAAAPPPDAFERYVLAHPFGLDVTTIATRRIRPICRHPCNCTALTAARLTRSRLPASRRRLRCRAPPDAFERYVAAHPYGLDVTNIPPDAFDRYAATHAAAPLTTDACPTPRTQHSASDPHNQQTSSRRTPTRHVASTGTMPDSAPSRPSSRSGRSPAPCFSSSGSTDANESRQPKSPFRTRQYARSQRGRSGRPVGRPRHSLGLPRPWPSAAPAFGNVT